jgi:glycerol kinase
LEDFMKGYLLALDQGTTSSRAVLYSASGETVGIGSRPLTQHYPRPGWVEHDAMEILGTQVEAVRDVLKQSGVQAKDIAALGIANQRETVVVWDRKSGEPVHRAIVWQCRRTSDICTRWQDEGIEPMIREKTGLVADAYFSGTKLQWLLQHVPGLRERAGRGELLAGTVDTWLVWNLTGGRCHVTDPSNASRTLLFNIHRMAWDPDLLALTGVPASMLARVVPSSGLVGEASPEWFGASIPIAGMAGDQQAALFGQGCILPGSVKNTYGTGCFILMNTGGKPVYSANRMLTTVAWDIGSGPAYALEGSIFNAGSAIQWLRDGLGMIASAKEADDLAETVPDAAGAFFVPAFTGLGAPWWDMYARGTMTGLTRGTTKAHFVRAVLESIAYQSRDVFEAMVSDFGQPILQLKVDGGASNSNILMQFQSDLIGLDVLRPSNIETTAAGAASLAGLASGMTDMESGGPGRAPGRTFSPRMERETASRLQEQWRKAVRRSMNWVES